MIWNHSATPRWGPERVVAVQFEYGDDQMMTVGVVGAGRSTAMRGTGLWQ
jgi:hypothetical protein